MTMIDTLTRRSVCVWALVTVLSAHCKVDAYDGFICCCIDWGRSHCHYAHKQLKNTLTGAFSPQDVMSAMQYIWQMHRQTAKLHRSCNKLGNSLSEISLPVRCKPLELALLVPVNVILPFCLVLMRHLHITACIMQL